MVKALYALDMLALVLMIVVLCVGVLASMPFYSKWYVTAALVLAPLVTTFILTPPDSWFYNDTDERFDKDLFFEQIGVGESTVVCDSSEVASVSELSGLGLAEGRHIVAFFSPKCGYCRLAAEKLSTIVTRHKLDGDGIYYVFPHVKDTASYADFYEKSRSAHYNETRIDKEVFVKITRASFPIVLLLDEGEVKASFAYRNIDEALVRDFLKKE